METLEKRLNDLKLIQKSIDWMEDLPEDIWQDFFKDKYKVLELDKNIDRHRWYNLADMVFELEGDKYEVQYVCDIHSEGMTAEDCYHLLVFSKLETNEI